MENFKIECMASLNVFNSPEIVSVIDFLFDQFEVEIKKKLDEVLFFLEEEQSSEFNPVAVVEGLKKQYCMKILPKAVSKMLLSSSSNCLLSDCILKEITPDSISENINSDTFIDAFIDVINKSEKYTKKEKAAFILVLEKKFK